MNFRAQTKTTMADFRKLEAFVQPRVIKAIEGSAALVADGARAIVAVDTGELRGSIRSTVEIKGTTVIGYVSASANHAMYVEFGTGIRGSQSAGAGPGPYRMDWPGMVAQPYLRPSLIAGKGRIMAEFGKVRT